MPAPVRGPTLHHFGVDMRFSHAPLSIAIAATLAMPSLAFATTPTNDSTLAAASAGTLIGQVKEGAQGVFLDGAVITLSLIHI